MSMTKITLKQATLVLDILQQNGLVVEPRERALTLLKPHITTTTTSTTTTSTPTPKTSSQPKQAELRQCNRLPVNPCLCQARIFGDVSGVKGWGGQCKRKPQAGKDYCGIHGTTKLPKSLTGLNGACKECSKAQGTRVVHQFHWEHLGRYTPGKITQGPKWKCVEISDSTVESPSPLETTSNEMEEAKAYFDAIPTEQLIAAETNSTPNIDSELIASLEAVSFLDWWPSYFQARVSSLTKADSTKEVTTVATEASPVVDSMVETTVATEESPVVDSMVETTVATEESPVVDSMVAETTGLPGGGVRVDSIVVDTTGVRVDSTADNADDSDDSDDADDSDDSDASDEESIIAWATGGTFVYKRMQVGWCKTTSNAFKINADSTKGTQLGSYNAASGKLIPIN